MRFLGALLAICGAVVAQEASALMAFGLNPQLAQILSTNSVQLTAAGTTAANATPLSGANIIVVTPNADNATARLVNVPSNKEVCVINAHNNRNLVLHPQSGERFGSLAVDGALTIPSGNGYCFLRIGTTYYPLARTLLNFDYSVNITITNFGEQNGDLTQLNATAQNIRFVNANTGVVFNNTSPFIRTTNDLAFQTGSTTRFLLRSTGDLEFPSTSGNITASRDNFTISNTANNLNINATQNVNFLTNSTQRWSVTSTGDLANNATTGGNLVFNRSGTGVSGTADMRISVPSANTLFVRAGNNDIAWFSDQNVTLNRFLRFAFSGTHIQQDALTINVPSGDFMIQIAATERFRISSSAITTNLPVNAPTFQSSSTVALNTTTANPISLRTNNLERFTVDASGNFVQNATNGNNIVFNRANTGINYSATSGNLRIATTTTGTGIQFLVNNTPFIELTPSGVLQVVAGSGGQIVATQGAGTFENVTWTGASQQTIGTVASQPVRFITNNTTRWRISNTGNLENDATGGGDLIFNRNTSKIANLARLEGNDNTNALNIGFSDGTNQLIIRRTIGGTEGTYTIEFPGLFSGGFRQRYLDIPFVYLRHGPGALGGTSPQGGRLFYDTRGMYAFQTGSFTNNAKCMNNTDGFGNLPVDCWNSTTGLCSLTPTTSFFSAGGGTPFMYIDNHATNAAVLGWRLQPADANMPNDITVQGSICFRDALGQTLYLLFYNPSQMRYIYHTSGSSTVVTQLLTNRAHVSISPSTTGCVEYVIGVSSTVNRNFIYLMAKSSNVILGYCS